MRPGKVETAALSLLNFEERMRLHRCGTCQSVEFCPFERSRSDSIPFWKNESSKTSGAQLLTIGFRRGRLSSRASNRASCLSRLGLAAGASPR